MTLNKAVDERRTQDIKTDTVFKKASAVLNTALGNFMENGGKVLRVGDDGTPSNAPMEGFVSMKTKFKSPKTTVVGSNGKTEVFEKAKGVVSGFSAIVSDSVNGGATLQLLPGKGFYSGEGKVITGLCA